MKEQPGKKRLDFDLEDTPSPEQLREPHIQVALPRGGGDRTNLASMYEVRERAQAVGRLLRRKAHVRIRKALRDWAMEGVRRRAN